VHVRVCVWQLMGDDPSILDEDTSRDIQKMRGEFHANKAAVIQMMAEHAVRVRMQVPEGRKSVSGRAPRSLHWRGTEKTLAGGAAAGRGCRLSN